MRVLLIAVCLLCAASAGAEPLVAFRWAGAKAAAEAGYEGSRAQALMQTMDPEAVVDAASRVAASLIRRVDEPDLAEGLATIERLRSASFAHPVTAWVDAEALDVRAPSPESLSGGVRWVLDEPAEAAALVAELERVVHELGHPAGLSVSNADQTVTLAYGVTSGPPATRAAPEALLSLDIGIARLWALVEPLLRAEMQQVGPDTLASYEAVVAVLDPAGLDGFSIRQFFEDGLWQTTTSVAAPAPRRGLARLLIDTPAVEDADLAAVPARAPVVAAFGLDLAAAWALAREAGAAASPTLLDDLDRQLRSVSDGFGVDIEAGLINAFGAVHTVFQDPDVAGGSSLGLVFTTRLRDADAFEEAFAALLDVANAMVEAQTADLWISGRSFVSERDGVAVTTIPLPGVSPSFAVVDGMLVAGVYPQSITAVLDRRRDGAGSILGTDAFAEALEESRKRAEEAGSPGVTSVSFVDLPELAPQAWGSLLVLEHVTTGLASMTSREPVPAVLPPFARVRPLLSAASGAGWATEEGSTSEAVAPFPGASMLGGGSDGGVSALFSLPSLLLGMQEEFGGGGGYNGFPDGDDPFDFPTPAPPRSPNRRDAPPPPAPPPSPFE